jgi:hypothetical protein
MSEALGGGISSQLCTTVISVCYASCGVTPLEDVTEIAPTISEGTFGTGDLTKTTGELPDQVWRSFADYRDAMEGTTEASDVAHFMTCLAAASAEAKFILLAEELGSVLAGHSLSPHARPTSPNLLQPLGTPIFPSPCGIN